MKRTRSVLGWLFPIALVMMMMIGMTLTVNADDQPDPGTTIWYGPEFAAFKVDSENDYWTKNIIISIDGDSKSHWYGDDLTLRGDGKLTFTLSEDDPDGVIAFIEIDSCSSVSIPEGWNVDYDKHTHLKWAGGDKKLRSVTLYSDDAHFYDFTSMKIGVAHKEDFNTADLVALMLSFIADPDSTTDLDPVDKEGIQKIRVAYEHLTSVQKSVFRPSAYDKMVRIEKYFNIDPNESDFELDNNEQVNVAEDQEVQEEVEAPEEVVVPNNDPEETFCKLRARVVNSGKNSITINWKKANGADGYLIYASKCSDKNMKLAKTINDPDTVKWTNSKLKKDTYYKYRVIAYKNVNGQKQTIRSSRIVYSATAGNKYTNAKSVKVNKTKVTLKKGKTSKISASVVKEQKGKKIVKYRGIRFESADPEIAAVNATTGKIKARKAGTTYIYAYAQNGVYKKIQVKVN